MDHNNNLDFKLFFDLNLDLLSINNPKGQFLSINQGFESTLGYTLDELHTLTPLDICHPDDRIKTKDKMETLSQGLKVIHFTNRMLHKNGTYKIIEWKNYPIDGLFYVTGRDITLLKQKEEELLNNQRRLDALIEYDSDYIFRISLDRKYTYANEKYIKAFLPQHTATSIIGVNAFDFSKDSQFEIIAGDAKDCIYNIGVSYQMEVKFHSPQGEDLYFLWDCICLADSNGNPSEIQMLGIDITEKKKREFKLKEKKALELLEQITPITKIWQGILFCPLTGMLNPERASKIVENILHKISETQAKVIIIDIIGIPVIDHQAANYFIKLSRATKLMGCTCLMSGISPAIAQIVIDLGIQIHEINSTSTLKDALQTALEHTGLKVEKLKEFNI